ncbi:MAG: TetR/AcrR family transcriptional regulator [Bernardetiaceae bacterium]
MIESARELFFRYGIRSVTMDELARHLGVSKKTLYQHFKDKADLVAAVTRLQIEEESCFIEQVQSDSDNAIDEVIKISEYVRAMFRQFHPSLLFDLRKYYPNSWRLFIQHKQGRMLQSIEANIARGIQEGLYRQGINPKILARVRMELIQITLDAEVFSPTAFDLWEVQVQVFDHYVHGITSPQGRSLWEQYTQNSHHSSPFISKNTDTGNL